MTRLLVLVLLAVVVWLLLAWGYRKLLASAGLDPATGRRPPRRGGTAVRGETLVRCDACGTYVPGSRALPERGRHACSPECRSRLHGGAP